MPEHQCINYVGFGTQTKEKDARRVHIFFFLKLKMFFSASRQ